MDVEGVVIAVAVRFAHVDGVVLIVDPIAGGGIAHEGIAGIELVVIGDGVLVNPARAGVRRLEQSVRGDLMRSITRSHCSP